MGGASDDAEYRANVAAYVELQLGSALKRIGALEDGHRLAVSQDIILQLIAGLSKPDRRGLVRTLCEAVLREGGWHGPFSVLHRG